jgi:hypothetical protein
MSTLALVGSCGCGAVRFEVAVPIPDDGLPRFDEGLPMSASP